MRNTSHRRAVSDFIAGRTSSPYAPERPSISAAAFMAGFSANGRLEAEPPPERKPVNLNEHLARERKAHALAETLIACGLTADQVERLATEETWRLATMTAKVLPPSVATRRMVIEIMRQREA